MMNSLSKRMAALALPATRSLRTGSLVTKELLVRGVSTRGLSFLMEDLQLKQKQHQQQEKQQPTIRTQTRSFFSSPISRETRVTPSHVFMPDNPIITDSSGRKFLVSDLMKPSKQKLKPKIIRRRLEKLKTYEGKEKNIRHSPWRLQLICRHVAGMPLQEALSQLEFLSKRFAPIVQRVLKRTSNLADIRDTIQMSQLEVAECFATQGAHLKRIKPMGRGRQGIMHHKYSHMRVVLREIDFPLKIYSARTVNEKARWIELQARAEADYEKARARREELESLQRIVALNQKEIG